VTAAFSLDWLGGWSERRLRRRRPGIDDLPWGSLDLTAHAPAAIDEARRVWTQGTFSEYASAAAFANLTTALLESGAPVDLTAVAADIVVDELDHVELVARLVGELGGAVELAFDLAKVSQAPDASARPLMRAVELALSVSCVGEALSVPTLACSRELATTPLVAAVLDRLLADEGPHAELGYRVLGWAMPLLDDGERARVAELALGAIAAFAPLWQGPACDACQAPALGVAAPADYRRTLRRTIDAKILPRLASHGVVVAPGALDRVLADLL
jgi:hypothetical protein